MGSQKVLAEGPDVKVLTYHHVQEMSEAIKKKQGYLTVSPQFFRKQMVYLKDKGYTVIGADEMNNFLNGGNLPIKSVMLTFDDAYDDVYTVAWPILREFGYRAVVFVPTGHVDNPEYLSWKQMEEMRNGGIYFGNHTWSHYYGSKDQKKIREEIILADTQLREHGQNQYKFFAYPYGRANNVFITVLSELGYSGAWTTLRGKSGAGRRWNLPRIKVGNANLSAYGL